MNHHFHVGKSYFPTRPSGVPKQVATPKPLNKSFQRLLDETIQAGSTQQARKLSFSQHALARLQNRGIKLAARDLQRLEGAVEKAAAKGAKESLILMDNVAYVVSIVNHKVITALDEDSMKENVFTNIDSAVLV